VSCRFPSSAGSNQIEMRTALPRVTKEVYVEKRSAIGVAKSESPPAGAIAAYTPADAASSAANARVTATRTVCHFSLEISEPLA
jgi:hypothetical protein